MAHPALRAAARGGRLLPVLVLAACASTPPEEDPVQIRLNEVDARVARVERVINNQSLVELSQRIDSLQGEIRQLRGRMDELDNALASARKEQRAAQAELERRAAAAAGTTTAAGAGAAAPGAVAPAAGAAAGGAAAGAAAAAAAPEPVASNSVEQALYNQAFEALKAGSYSVAIASFKEFLGSYPASPLAENAQFWLGEAYYVSHEFEPAATAFRTVLAKYPNGRKAPDAMLKLGYTQFELKRYGESRGTLTELTQRFPGTDAARLAAERLKRPAPRG